MNIDRDRYKDVESQGKTQRDKLRMMHIIQQGTQYYSDVLIGLILIRQAKPPSTFLINNATRCQMINKTIMM